MKRIGIGAIIVLLLIAYAHEYIQSGERRKAVFDAIDAELRASAESAAPPGVSEEMYDSTQRLADTLSEVAAVGSLLNEAEAQEFRAQHELLYRSHGAVFRMHHETGFCTIEVQLPGAYAIHASGRDGKASSRIEWE